MTAAPAVSPGRLRAAWAMMALAVAAILVWSLSGPGLLKPNGEPIAPDFGIFYTAGRLALAEGSVAPYDWRAVTAAFDSFFGFRADGVSWNYPPPLLLPVMGLATLPYLAAAALWTVAGLALYVGAIRLVAPGAVFMLVAMAFPGTTMNAVAGQTGLLVTAAFGAGLALLDRRPFVAGALLGLLALKPNLAVLVPIALLAGGHWRTLAGAGLAALALAAIAILAFGLAPWAAFLDNMRTVAAWGDEGLLQLNRMPGVYAQLRALGVDAGSAKVVQAVSALAAAAVVVWAWRRPVPYAVKAAVLVAAVPLAPPYVFEYDLAILILPVLWLWRDGLASGQHPAEPWVLLVAWTIGVLPPMITEKLGVHPGLALSIALLALAVRRARA